MNAFSATEKRITFNACAQRKINLNKLSDNIPRRAPYPE